MRAFSLILIFLGLVAHTNFYRGAEEEMNRASVTGLDGEEIQFHLPMI